MGHIAAPQPVANRPRKSWGISHAVRAENRHPFHGRSAMELDRLFAVPRALIRC
jgi:hypothetical protein